MKKALFLILFIPSFLVSTFLNAQMPDGSFVPNFETRDINGEPYNLYELLSQGYRVVLDIMTTWCDPCWDYHETGALKELHEMYGPDGTGEIFVLMIEADDWNSPEDLDGTGTYTLGDWVTGTNYPIIDDGGFIAKLLSINGYPTIYTICPDGKIYSSSTKNAQAHYDFAMGVDCQAVPFDVAVQSKQQRVVCHESFDTWITLVNAGIDVLTQATITMDGCDNCPMIKEFNGELEHFNYAQIHFENVELANNKDLTFSIDVPDNNEDNNESIMNISIGSVPSYETWEIELLTDCFPWQNSWTIEDENCNIIAKGIGYNEENTLYTETVQLPTEGCYTLTFKDKGGDGLNGTSGNCTLNGTFYVSSPLGTIYFTDGTNHFSEIKVNGDVAFAVNTQNDFFNKEDLIVAPNPAKDFTDIIIDDLNGNKLKIDVIDINGKILQTDFYLNVPNLINPRVDLSTLNSGVYLLKITDPENIMVKKLVIN